MKVCLVIEGAYPYVVGGVSSWVHNLIKSMPDIEFKILSIMSSKKDKNIINYELPENVIEFRTAYLDAYMTYRKNEFILQTPFGLSTKGNMGKLLNFDEEVDLKKVLTVFKRYRSVRKIVNFTRTKFFYKILSRRYEEKYEKLDYNKYIWSSKGMFSPFLQMFNVKIPKADVYHSVSAGYAGLLGAIGKAKYNKPFILSEHGIYTRERQEEIIKATWVSKIFKMVWIDFFFYVSRIGYKYADQITSLFEQAKEFQVMYGALEHKCTVIPNGVDVESFDVGRLRHSTFNVGFITRVVPIKDVLTAIRAFYLVNKELVDVHFYIIGPTDEDELYFRQCKHLVNELGLSDVVEFTGRVNVKDYLKTMDCVILSSISEGQPLVLLEAMSAGIPCVASDVGSCNEVLRGDKELDEKCGLIFEATKYDQLAAKIIYLYNNPKYAARIGYNGKLIAHEQYDYKDMVKKYRALYENY